MAYYTLICRDNNVWSIQFGDYDKETVQYELNDYASSNRRAAGYWPKKDMRIVKTKSSRQSEIDNILRKLNHESER